MKSKEILKYLSVLILTISLIVLSYSIKRENFMQLATVYTISFSAFIWLNFKEKVSFKELYILGVIIRCILLFSEPNLSNDYYRFIWDGRMSLKGLNPYLSLPENWVKENPTIINHSKELYKGMGALNGSHFTCYPPINQLYFIVSSLFTDRTIFGSAFTMRLLIFISEIGLVYFAVKILKKINLPINRIHLYWLNPFIILESHVNLHFEGVMVFFLAIALWYTINKRIYLAAFFFAISVSVKAIPLIFAPLFFYYFGFKRFVLFGLTTLLSLILFFSPFLSQELYDNFMRSIELYFTNFEFNGSIYYIIRYIGFQVKGYNIIQTVGKIMPFILISVVCILSLLKKNKDFKGLINSFLIVISFYYFTATTVHPWYIILPLFVSIFQNKYNYILWWSFLLILSYSAYSDINFKENPFLLTIEYVLLYSILFFEIRQITLLKKNIHG